MTGTSNIDAARRAAARQAVAHETGIDEAMVKSLVHKFYDKVREDDLLGPVFEARISDWDKHLGVMCEFWSSIALTSGRYHGQPMRKHAHLPVGGLHFDRWLMLFRVSAHEVCPTEAAKFFILRAERIAESFELGIAGSRGQMLRKGERLSEIVS